MRSATILSLLWAVAVQAQTATYASTAGILAPSIDPLAQNDKTPGWPKSASWGPVPYGPAPTGCAKFEVIIARGTFEPGPFGIIVGDPLLARIEKLMPNGDVRGYAVQYDAILTSRLQGSADITARLAQQSKDCPNERFALVGYSQGAMAMHTATIPPAIAEKILAVVMYGDPAMGAPDYATEWMFPGVLANRTLENCAGGDGVCKNLGKLGDGHISYNNKGTRWHDQSAEFIVSAFEGKPLQGSTGKDWDAPWLGNAV